MNPVFDQIFTDPINQIFQVVFFPDRIYHAEYLNASRCSRYRYNVEEVRSKIDITVLKGQVYMDGQFLTNFLRIEYRASRLVEAVRIKNRLISQKLIAWVRVRPVDAGGADINVAEALIPLHFCPWTNCFQAEIWQTLEPVPGSRHDFTVIDMMGYNGEISRIKAFDAALNDLGSLKRLDLAFREDILDFPSGFPINDPAWDNNFLGSHQEPRNPTPSSPDNTISDENYEVNFQRGFYFPDVTQLTPVRYHNAMMYGPDNPQWSTDITQNNVEMRWIVQRDMGTSVVFFHHVTIPPHTTEGTHQHIGSEELYCVIEGSGFVYMGSKDNDDPAVLSLPDVQRDIFGLGFKPCKKLPVQLGSVIFTKSGGIHGIENPNDTPLKFVAFLYHAS